MTTTHQLASQPKLSLVPPEQTSPPDAGHALVIGPFPPLIGPAAGHASALLHLFKETGYSVRSATGPGLALARHSLNFASETRLRKSTAFLDECDGDDVAVIYAKSFDFGKISKPYWYKRRLEELRRLRLLTRIVRTFRETSLVLEDKPFRSRYQISLWAVARLTGLLCRKPIKILSQKEEPAKVFQSLTGLKRSAPTAYKAEETAYDAAFNADGPEKLVRLTVGRAEQALNFWVGRTPERADSKTASDLRELISVAQRFDLNRLPHFRLLWDVSTSPAQERGSVSTSRSSQIANDLLDPEKTFGVPITRYMRHLWVSLGPHRKLRISSRLDAEAVLKWYLFDAPQRVPAGSVPIPKPVRDYFLDDLSGGMLDFEPASSDLIHARGRDLNPFSLSKELTLLANSKHALAQRFNIDDPIDRLGFVLEYLLTKRGSDCGIGESAKAYLREPIGGDSQNVSRLQFLLALQGRCKLDGRHSIEAPWADNALKLFADVHCAKIFPAIGELTGRATPTAPSAREFAVTGLPKSETGVGSNLHMSVSALKDAGVEPKVYDTADGMRALDGDGTQMRVRKLKRSAALHHVNADSIPQSLLAPNLRDRDGSYHIGFLLWEFDVLPQSHRLALNMLDEIWTPTEFLRQAYAKTCDKPVRNMLKGLHIPHVPSFDLSALGVQPGTTTFLTCFDFHSSVSRKNPLAAVQAFKNAFPKTRKDVQLIVKTTPVVKNHWGDPENQMRKIYQLAANDERIKVVTEYYSFNRLLSLIKACDCLISPHRAEGFGLMPAYALGMARAVMATDYSGTTDFCTPLTSFPIPYKEVAVERHQVLHPLKNATWAEIDKDALTGMMRDFVDDQTDGLMRAARGQDLIKTRFSPRQQAKRYQMRLKEIGIT